jgi:hypothetical protein
MNRTRVALIVSVAVGLAVAPPVSADPRMETNDNFCHFIMDPVNTDNEVFAAACDSAITTLELASPPGTTSASCKNLVATGYGERTAVVPQAAIGVRPGTTLSFTSADSETPCTMVESNGRAYRSYKWKGRIRVEAAGRPGWVRVHGTLLCLDGRL